MRPDAHRQHLAQLGVLRAHDLGHTTGVNLQRVYAQVGKLDSLGQPGRQHLGVERLGAMLQAGAAQSHQRMQAGVAGTKALGDALGIGRRHHCILNQPIQQLAPFEAASGHAAGFVSRARRGGHAFACLLFVCLFQSTPAMDDGRERPLCGLA